MRRCLVCRGSCRGFVGSIGLRVGVIADAEDFLEEVLRAFGHLTAAVDWRGAVEEGVVATIAGAACVGAEA